MLDLPKTAIVKIMDRRVTYPKVQHLVNISHCDAMDYYTYCIADKASKYADHVSKSVFKWAKELQVEMTTITFDSFNLISKFCFYQH